MLLSLRDYSMKDFAPWDRLGLGKGLTPSRSSWVGVAQIFSPWALSISCLLNTEVIRAINVKTMYVSSHVQLKFKRSLLTHRIRHPSP